MPFVAPVLLGVVVAIAADAPAPAERVEAGALERAHPDRTWRVGMRAASFMSYAPPPLLLSRVPLEDAPSFHRLNPFGLSGSLFAELGYRSWIGVRGSLAARALRGCALGAPQLCETLAAPGAEADLFLRATHGGLETTVRAGLHGALLITGSDAGFSSEPVVMPQISGAVGWRFSKLFVELDVHAPLRADVIESQWPTAADPTRRTEVTAFQLRAYPSFGVGVGLVL